MQGQIKEIEASKTIHLQNAQLALDELDVAIDKSRKIYEKLVMQGGE